MKEVLVVWLISMDPRKKSKTKKNYEISQKRSKPEWNWAGCVARRTDNCWTTLITTPRGHLEWEPRKTKDEMEEKLRSFCKTLASCCAKRGPVEVNGSLLRGRFAFPARISIMKRNENRV